MLSANTLAATTFNGNMTLAIKDNGNFSLSLINPATGNLCLIGDGKLSNGAQTLDILEQAMEKEKEPERAPANRIVINKVIVGGESDHYVQVEIVNTFASPQAVILNGVDYTIVPGTSLTMLEGNNKVITMMQGPTRAMYNSILDMVAVPGNGHGVYGRSPEITGTWGYLYSH